MNCKNKFKTIEKSLTNGFHDCIIVDIKFKFEQKTLKMHIETSQYEDDSNYEKIMLSTLFFRNVISLEMSALSIEKESNIFEDQISFVDVEIFEKDFYKFNFLLLNSGNISFVCDSFQYKEIQIDFRQYDN